ncbi:chorismate mutase [Photobacterium minamisatsumaniensis]|uniref:chorismate mutase n=1 Tax=Photobacterium minamisatsumaniensis TaxID=2910233 RepID=UPI003D121F09
MFKTIMLLGFALLSFNSWATDTKELFSIINERLSYMEDVALYKAQNQIAIEDVKREKVVIEKAASSAEQMGLESASVVPFFTAQISAAKAIQYRYRADLLSKPNTDKPRDLKTVVRPALITLGNQINTEVASYLTVHGSLNEKDWANFKLIIDSRYLSENDKKMLFNALKEIRLN